MKNLAYDDLMSKAMSEGTIVRIKIVDEEEIIRGRVRSVGKTYCIEPI